MTTLTEQAAALLLTEHAFSPATPGFVGAEVDLPLGPPGLPDALLTALALRPVLRHGFLTARSARLAVVSGPPSPGLETCLDRMADDLADPLPLLGAAAAPEGHDGGGVRVSLEAGLDGGGPLGLRRRWALANTLAPVLAAAFANSPLRDGQPTGWRSTRQSRHRDHPVLSPIADPRAAWAAYVLGADGPFRAAARPRLSDLVRHVDALRPPVAARGHLEIDVADRPPGDGWRVVVAVTSVLLDDPRAAAAAEEITAPLAAEPRLWERAARDALTDPVLAAAARGCFVEAYGTLSRHGARRDLRDAVAEFTERYVMRGRCPADEVLAARTGEVRPVRR
ncbi:glutamate-cysteine ligase family protein [Actinoplanes sp. TRM 88003]|uniref:glutamate--cysteine ligase n=1 Tax=Paractinoplanes aksuensis TaxID=2939490 RepID=A0ABT1DTR5_9ACTN|nr:glutamate-cysteine ligase family protein [Actinoplanes aksuensis]MCO8274248.1 glutamate-cysteine ligase family protein [Actinoplanes aksuensis]